MAPPARLKSQEDLAAVPREVLEGIAEGERVVTEGGYQVRLASLSTGVPTGHGHAH